MLTLKERMSKRKSSQSTQKNNLAPDDSDKVTNLVKSVLLESNVLQECFNENPLKSLLNEKSFQPSSENLEILANKLKNDKNFIDIVTSKLCTLIISNKAFMQTIVDKVSIECESKVLTLNETAGLESRLEEQEQYSRRNCLLIHGVPSVENENTDETAKEFFHSHLDIKLADYDLDRSHRLGNSKNNGPIIVKFTRHNTKQKIYLAKSKLKGKGFFITESLTKRRKECFKKLKNLRATGSILYYWSMDGEIYYISKRQPNKKVHLKSLNTDTIPN